MAYFSICGLEFLKTIVLFEINTFKFVENESLTHRVNFGKEPAFSKGPGTAFSEGPGSGLLYKVRCCILLLFALGIGAFGSNGNSTPKFHSVLVLFLHHHHSICQINSHLQTFRTDSCHFLQKTS